MAYTPGNQPGSGKSKIIDNRVKKGSGDRKATQTSQSLAGTYKTQEIDGKKYTSFVPDNVKITSKESVVSGGKPSSNIARQLANVPSPVSKTVTVEGRRTTAPVPVSQGVYGRLSGEQLAKPEPNTQYFAQLTQGVNKEKDKTYTPQQIPQKEQSNKPVSTLTRAPEPEDRFRAKADEFSYKAATSTETFQKMGFQLAALGTSLYGETTRPFRKPVATVKETFGFFKNVATNPGGTFQAIGQDAIDRPGVFVGGIGSQILIGKGAQKAGANLVTSNVKTGSLSITKVITTQEGKGLSTSIVQGKALVERKLLGFIKLPDKEATFLGKALVKSEESGYLGGVSKEPILKTSGEAKFDVAMGRKKFTIISDSVGGQVAGVGQRKANILLVNKKINLVETFVSKPTTEGYFGGVVNKKGVDIFGGRRMIPDVDTTYKNSFVSAKYVDDFTGLDYVGNNYKGKTLLITENVKEMPANVRVFEGGSLGQGQRPKSAILTRIGAIDLLKREAAGKTKVGGVEVFKSSNANGLISKTDMFAVESLKFDNLVGKGIQAQATTKVKISPAVGNLVGKQDNTRTTQTTTTLSPQRSRMVSYIEVRDVGVATVLPKSNIRVASNVGIGLRNIPLVGRGSRVSNIADTKAKPISSVIPSVKPISSSSLSSEILPKSTAKTSQTQATTLKQAQAQTYKYGFDTGLSRTPFVVPVRTFKLPVVGSNGKKGGFSVEVRRFGKFQVVGRGLNQEKALNLGKGIVQGSAARTFRLKRGGVPVSVGALGGFYTRGSLNIERSQFAINTGGERADITFAPRKKKGRLSVY